MRYDVSREFGEAVRGMVEEWLKENPDGDLKELLAPLVRASREKQSERPTDQ